jgi:hypothetical protein
MDDIIVINRACSQSIDRWNIWYGITDILLDIYIVAVLLLP